LYDKWRGRGAALCVLAVAMMIIGIGLLLCLGVPATWGWWL
jgi:hypothetical protein